MIKNLTFFRKQRPLIVAIIVLVTLYLTISVGSALNVDFDKGGGEL